MRVNNGVLERNRGGEGEEAGEEKCEVEGERCELHCGCRGGCAK